MQTTLDAQAGGFQIVHPYYKKDPLPPSEKPNLIREEGTLEYVHRWEELLGAMCRAGLAIEDMTEPMHAKPDAEANSFAHRCQFVAHYIRVKARRMGERKTRLVV